MKAIVTHGFLESIPEKIRTKLHLHTGMILDFDEEAPYLKATPSESPEEITADFETWLAASTGIAKGKFTTDELMRETRGED